MNLQSLTVAQLQVVLANPITFDQLSAQQQSDAIDTIQNAPNQPFTTAQIALFADCWFLPTQAQVDAMNRLLPDWVRLGVYTIGATLCVCMDVLAECANPASPFAALLPTLKTIPMQYTTAVAQDVAAKAANAGF